LEFGSQCEIQIGWKPNMMEEIFGDEPYNQSSKEVNILLSRRRKYPDLSA
jgi:hypothetical protein